MTYDELVRALTAASNDAREVLSKIKDIAVSNNDVVLTFYDGTQITIPSLPQLQNTVNSFVNNAEGNIKSWWNRTFYVDAVNGDDVNGDGSQNAPFKTIKKAVDSVPVGGHGIIILRGSDNYNNPEVYIIDDDIVLYNKYISLRTDGINRFAKISSEVILENNVLNQNYAFILYNSMIDIYSNDHSGYVILENPKKIDPSKGWVWHRKAIFSIHGGCCAVGLRGWPSSNNQIIMTDEGGSNIITVVSRNASVSFGYINFWYLRAELENSNCKIVDFYQGDSHSSGGIDARVVSITDSTGNNIAFKDTISGIVTDATTGLPKNILTATF